MDKETLYNEIVDLLKIHLSATDVHGPIIKDETFGWDSIKHLILCFALEDKYRINLTKEEVLEINSSEAAAEIVFSKINGNS